MTEIVLNQIVRIFVFIRLFYQAFCAGLGSGNARRNSAKQAIQRWPKQSDDRIDGRAREWFHADDVAADEEPNHLGADQFRTQLCIWALQCTGHSRHQCVLDHCTKRGNATGITQCRSEHSCDRLIAIKEEVLKVEACDPAAGRTAAIVE